jgi:hypothetical protein
LQPVEARWQAGEIGRISSAIYYTRAIQAPRYREFSRVLAGTYPPYTLAATLSSMAG